MDLTCFLISLTVGVVSLLLGALVVGASFRRHISNSSSRMIEYQRTLDQRAAHIAEQQKAIQDLIYQYHHYGLNPKCKRLRGISDLGLRPVERLQQNLVLLSRPNHYKYAKVAIKELEEIKVWWEQSIIVCLDIEKDIIESANKFNHLQ